MIDLNKLTQLEQQYGLPQGLLNAVMMKESGGNPKAVSPAGAQGLFQFMPSTAKAYGVDPFDPESSAVGAARMYGDLNKQYEGDIDKMLAAYNWGSGNLSKFGMEKAPEETRKYIEGVKAALPQYADSGQVMTDAAVDVMDVEMPDGTVITDVPAGTTQAQLLQMLEGSKPQEYKRPETSGLAAFADSALQGATANLSDEAEAGMRTGARGVSRFLEKLIYGDNVLPEANYEDELGGVRNRISQEQQDSPYLSAAGSVAGAVGGLATGGAALARFAPQALNSIRAAATAAPYATAAKGGAISGALYGFGGGEGSALERGKEALLGGAAGGVTGPAATYAGQTIIAPVVRKTATGLSKTAQKFGLKTSQPVKAATPPSSSATPVPPATVTKTNGETFSKTAGQRTQDPITQRLENDARAGILSTEAESAIRNADVAQNREFIGFVNKLAGGLDDGKDVNALVEGIGSSIQSNAKAANQAVNSAYELAKQGKGVKIGIEDIRKGLWRGIVDTKKEGAYDLTQMPKASAVLSRLADYSKKRGFTKVTSVKLGEMENWRKQVTNAIASSQDPTEKRFLGQMLGNYDNFMEKTAADAVDIGDAQAINAFKTAVKSRREYGQLFEKNKLVESIVSGQKSVDDTVKDLMGTGSIKGKKEMANTVKAIMDAGDENVPADLKQAFMKRAFDKATLGTEPNNPNVPRLSPAKLKTELENIFVHQKDFATQLYGKDAVAEAQKAIKELELISTTQSNVKNASGSGELVGRLLKVLGKVPVVGRTAGPISSVVESSAKYKSGQEVIKGLEEFQQTLATSPKSPVWAIVAPVATTAPPSEKKREPLKLTIPRPD